MNVKIVSAKVLEKKKIFDYLKKIYPERSIKVHDLWEWLYRSESFNYETSLLAIQNNNIVGHAGSIPFSIKINNNIFKAKWFIDFIIDSDKRNLGIGKRLTNEWMNDESVGVTFCNDQSINVFKKFGWTETFHSYMHYILLRPLNHERFINKYNKFKYIKSIINFLYNFFIFYYYYFCSSKKIDIHLLSLENLSIFNNEKSDFINTIKTYRDNEYLKWRFLKFPDSHLFRKLTNKNNHSCIIKLRKDKKKSHHVDILLFEDNLSAISKNILISDVVVWSSKNQFSYVRLHTSNLSESLKIKKKLFPVVIQNRFAYFVKNNEIKNKFKDSKFHWQLFDSDFDIIN